MNSFLLTSTLPNLCLLMHLLNDQLYSVKRWTVGLIFVGQSTATILCFLPLATYPKAFHNPAKVLVSIQMRFYSATGFKSLLLPFKFKLNDLLARLFREQKYGCTAGSLVVVTCNSIFKVTKFNRSICLCFNFFYILRAFLFTHVSLSIPSTFKGHKKIQDHFRVI